MDPDFNFDLDYYEREDDYNVWEENQLALDEYSDFSWQEYDCDLFDYYDYEE